MLFRALDLRAATIDELLSDEFEAPPEPESDADLAAGASRRGAAPSTSGDWRCSAAG